MGVRESAHEIYPPGLWEKLLAQKMHLCHLSPRACVLPDPEGALGMASMSSGPSLDGDSSGAGQVTSLALP